MAETQTTREQSREDVAQRNEVARREGRDIV